LLWFLGFMKLRVIHEDGSTETLVLRSGQWAAIEGGQLNRLRSETGLEHFFTKDGHYDGWGAGVGESAPHADQILSALEAKRRVER
jgi:hypothetical protein